MDLDVIIDSTSLGLFVCAYAIDCINCGGATKYIVILSKVIGLIFEIIALYLVGSKITETVYDYYNHTGKSYAGALIDTDETPQECVGCYTINLTLTLALFIPNRVIMIFIIWCNGSFRPSEDYKEFTSEVNQKIADKRTNNKHQESDNNSGDIPMDTLNDPERTEAQQQDNTDDIPMDTLNDPERTEIQQQDNTEKTNSAVIDFLNGLWYGSLFCLGDYLSKIYSVSNDEKHKTRIGIIFVIYIMYTLSIASGLCFISTKIANDEASTVLYNALFGIDDEQFYECAMRDGLQQAIITLIVIILACVGSLIEGVQQMLSYILTTKNMKNKGKVYKNTAIILPGLIVSGLIVVLGVAIKQANDEINNQRGLLDDINQNGYIGQGHSCDPDDSTTNQYNGYGSGTNNDYDSDYNTYTWYWDR